MIKLTKQLHVPDEPPTKAPQRTEIPIVGTLSNIVKDLDQKAKDKETYIKNDARKEWKRIKEIGDNSVLEKMQQMGKQKIDDSFIGTKIEYLSEFDLVGEGNMKGLC